MGRVTAEGPTLKRPDRSLKDADRPDGLGSEDQACMKTTSGQVVALGASWETGDGRSRLC